MTSYSTNSISKEYILCRIIRNADWYTHRKKRKQNKISFPNIVHGSEEFCNKEKEIAEYQELGEVSKSTNYENLT